MKASIEIDFKPFNVPNFVVADNDMEAREANCENQSFPLSVLSPEALDKMCDEFRKSVFAKAKKQPPPTAVEMPPCPICQGRSSVTALNRGAVK